MTKAGRLSSSANGNMNDFQRKWMEEGLCWASAPGIQFPGCYLIESFKTRAFLQKMERLRALNWELYGNCLVKRKLKDYSGHPGLFPCEGHTQNKWENAFSRKYRFVWNYHPAWTELHWQDLHVLYKWFFSLPCPCSAEENAVKGQNRAAVTRGWQRTCGTAWSTLPSDRGANRFQSIQSIWCYRHIYFKKQF